MRDEWFPDLFDGPSWMWGATVGFCSQWQVVEVLSRPDA